MICPKCNTQCTNNYCIRCGIFFKSENAYLMPKESLHENDLEIFVGKNSDRLIHTNFNLGAAIFNFLYYLYRKCVLFGIVLFFIQVYIYHIWRNVLNYNYIYIILINFLFFMIFGNSIYIGISKMKVMRISKKNNFKHYLIKKGGTNIIFPIIFVLTVLIIFYLKLYNEV